VSEASDLDFSLSELRMWFHLGADDLGLRRSVVVGIDFEVQLFRLTKWCRGRRAA
jgi:hypothetical protein